MTLEIVSNKGFKKTNLKNWIIIFLISIFTAFYIDIFSQNDIGVYLSYFLFFGFIILAVVNIMEGFKWLLILFMTIPILPRNILDSYDALLDATMEYNTLFSTPMFGLGMIQWLVIIYIFFFAISLLNDSAMPRKRLFVVLGLILFPLLVTLVYGIIDSNRLQIREVATAMRFPTYIVLGIFAATYIKCKQGNNGTKKYVINILIISSLISCIRVPLFFVWSLAEATPSLDLGALAGVCFTTLFVLLLIGKEHKVPIFIIALLLLSLVTTSRTYIFILLICFILYVILSGATFKLFINTIILIIAIAALFWVMAEFFPALYDFIMWKLEDFKSGGELSESGQIRIYEFLNITNDMLKNPFTLLFGKGLSGYFTFDAYPPPFLYKLDLKSYQFSELASGIYYHPHFFANVMLLKYGIVGLVVYITVIWKMFIRAWRIRKQECGFISKFIIYSSIIIAPIFVLDMFFRGPYAILFPFLLYMTNSMYITFRKTHTQPQTNNT